MTDIGDERTGRFRIGDIEVDPDGLKIRLPSSEVSLEPKVMQVLVQLAAKAGEVVTRSKLIETVWNVSYGGDESLTRAISILRKHLEADVSGRRVIETVPRRGYRLIADVSPLSEELSSEEIDKPILSKPKRPPGVWVTWSKLFLTAVALLLAVLIVRAVDKLSFDQPDTANSLVTLSDDENILFALDGAFQGFRESLESANREHRVFASDSGDASFTLKLSSVADGREGEFKSELYLAGISEPLFVQRWKSFDQSAQIFAERFVIHTSHETQCFGDLFQHMTDELQQNTDFLKMLFDLCSMNMGGQIFRASADASEKMLAAFPDDPSMKSLHALILLSRPTLHWQGREDVQEEATLAYVETLLTEAKLAGQSGELIDTAEILLKARRSDLVTQDMLLASLNQKSWISVTAGNWRTTLLRRTGRLAEANYLLSEVVKAWPGYADGHAALALTYIVQGDYDDAGQAIETAQDIFPERRQFSIFQEIFTVFYGSDDAARALLENHPMPQIAACMSSYRDALERSATFDASKCDVLDPTHRSRLFALLGDQERAFALIETFDSNAPGVGLVLHYAEFNDLWQTDKMWQIADRFGLTDYWRETGKRPDMCYRAALQDICDARLG